MLSIQVVHGLPHLCAPGIVPCIISFSRQLLVSSWCDHSMLASLAQLAVSLPNGFIVELERVEHLVLLCIWTEPVQELSLWEPSERESECCSEAHSWGWENSRRRRQSVCCPVMSSLSLLLSFTVFTAVNEHRPFASGVGNFLIVCLFCCRHFVCCLTELVNSQSCVHYTCDVIDFHCLCRIMIAVHGVHDW